MVVLVLSNKHQALSRRLTEGAWCWLQGGAPVAKSAHLAGNASDGRDGEEEDAWCEGAQSDKGQQFGEEAEEEASAGSMLEDPGHILLNGRLGPQVSSMQCCREGPLWRCTFWGAKGYAVAQSQGLQRVKPSVSVCVQKEANPAAAGSKGVVLPVTATRQMALRSRAEQVQPSASAPLTGNAMSGAGAAKLTRGAQKRMQADEAAAAQSAGLGGGSASSSRSSSEGREDAGERGRVGVKQTLAQRLGLNAQDASMAPAAKRLRLNGTHAAPSDPRSASGSMQHAPSQADGRGSAGAHKQQPAQQRAGTSLARLVTRATAAAAAGSAEGTASGRDGSAAALGRAASRDAPAAKGVVAARSASGQLRRTTVPDEDAKERHGAGQGRRAPGVDDEQQVQGAPKKAAAKAGGTARGLFGAAMAGISVPRQGKKVLT